MDPEGREGPTTPREVTSHLQASGFFWLDLEDPGDDELAEMVDALPGRRPGARQLHDRHRQRVNQIRQIGRDIREEAKDALSHYSDHVAGRQAHVVTVLTIVATVFLPLSFLTGYFGMNFATLNHHVQNTLWEFILLGVLLLIASAVLSLLLIHRLQRRLGLRARDLIGQRSS